MKNFTGGLMELRARKTSIVTSDIWYNKFFSRNLGLPILAQEEKKDGQASEELSFRSFRQADVVEVLTPLRRQVNNRGSQQFSMDNEEVTILLVNMQGL